MSYCLICKNQGLEARAKVRDYFSNEQFTILICPSCQTGRTYPFLSQKEVVPYYQNQNYICHSDTKKGAVNVLYHFVRQYMLSYKWHKIQHFYKSTSNIRILDYGSGTGYFLNYCQKKVVIPQGQNPSLRQGSSANRNLI